MTQGGSQTAQDPAARRAIDLEDLLAAALLHPGTGASRSIGDIASDGGPDDETAPPWALALWSAVLAIGWKALDVALVEPELRAELATREEGAQLESRVDLLLSMGGPSVAAEADDSLRLAAHGELRFALDNGLLEPAIMLARLRARESTPAPALFAGAAAQLSRELEVRGLPALAALLGSPNSAAFRFFFAIVAHQLHHALGARSPSASIAPPSEGGGARRSLVDRWVSALDEVARLTGRSRSGPVARPSPDEHPEAHVAPAPLPSPAPAPVAAPIEPAPAFGPAPAFEPAPATLEPATEPSAPPSAALSRSPEPPSGSGAAEPRLDDDVQFTVYRPSAVVADRWYDLLAFAHHSRRTDKDDPELDPLEEVERQAAALLGPNREAYLPLREESSQGIPLDSDLTFIPVLPGFEVNPPRRTFRWNESVHREEFRIRAPHDLLGRRIRGHLSVYLGSILVADVQLGVRVESEVDPADAELTPESARRYRKIFASYSHKDVAIVDQFVRMAKAFGDEYLIDCVHLRAGEVWSERLRKLVEEADVFQLFWSWNSIESPFVRAEWEHAIHLNRPNFIRPTYWERPLPMLKEKNLPPAELARLHFQDIGAALEDNTAAAGALAAPATGAGVPEAAARARAHPAQSPPAKPPTQAKSKAPFLAIASAAAAAFLLFIGSLTLRNGSEPESAVAVEAPAATRPADDKALPEPPPPPSPPPNATATALATTEPVKSDHESGSGGRPTVTPSKPASPAASAAPPPASAPSAAPATAGSDAACSKVEMLAARGRIADAARVFESCAGDRREAARESIALGARAALKDKLAVGDCSNARAIVAAAESAGAGEKARPLLEASTQCAPKGAHAAPAPSAPPPATAPSPPNAAQ